MKINVFEGARRIAILTGILWALGVIAYLWIERPDIELGYVVDWPGMSPKRVIGEPWRMSCGSNDAQRTEFRDTARGTRVRAVICFTAQKASDGRMMIPYRSDKNQWWGDTPYSTEVYSYTGKVADSLLVSAADEAWADDQYWPARWKQFGIGAVWLLGGLAALWLFTFTTGWIVRGFAGIPMGKDHRESGSDPQ